jgi:hypothetical protein
VSLVPTGVAGIATGVPGVGPAEVAGDGDDDAERDAPAVGATEVDAEGVGGLVPAPQPATSAATSVATTGTVAHRAREKRRCLGACRAPFMTPSVEVAEPSERGARASASLATTSAALAAAGDAA